ncbi:MAG: molybdopterin-dependent oxidoreductase [Chloroflexota bacterium]|nr:molybdopterin-dependent oxidoreductase [Chloroflexota bacterium]
MTETRPRTTGPDAGESAGARRPAPMEPDAPTIGDWLQIERDGRVIVYAGKTEMGQNIRTSLAQAVAEELRIPVTMIEMVLADTAHTPYDMGTVGSRTTPIMARRLHQVAAATRELLVDLAAARWQIERDQLRVGDSKITPAPTGQSVSFGELTQGQRLTQEYDDTAPVTPVHQWTLAGTSVAKVDGWAIVTGERRYTPDMTRPAMLIGKMLRAPAFGAKLTALDTTAAAQPGVVVVHEGDFVGVVASNRVAATQALAAIRAEWIIPEQIAAHALYTYLKDHPAPQQDQRFGGPEQYEHGSLTDGRAAADQLLAQTYTVAYIAHAPLEPRAALAEWAGSTLTVWTGTQRPFGVRSELAQAFGLPEDAIGAGRSRI